MEFEIRVTTAEDYFATECLTRDAFWDLFRPGCDEHLMVHQIRESDDYLPQLDHVAVIDGRIVGHILYTKARLVGDDGEHPLIAFGPVSVHPEAQNKGIGSALIEHTKQVAKTFGYRAIGIYGHPGYYRRFGFRNAATFGITTPDGKNFDAFMVLPLYEGSLEGVRGKLYESSAFQTQPDVLEAFDKAFPYREKRFGIKQG